jgi:hypothetical protein
MGMTPPVTAGVANDTVTIDPSRALVVRLPGHVIASDETGGGLTGGVGRVGDPLQLANNATMNAIDGKP